MAADLVFFGRLSNVPESHQMKFPIPKSDTFSFIVYLIYLEQVTQGKILPSMREGAVGLLKKSINRYFIVAVRTENIFSANSFLKQNLIFCYEIADFLMVNLILNYSLGARS